MPSEKELKANLVRWAKQYQKAYETSFSHASDGLDKVRDVTGLSQLSTNILKLFQEEVEAEPDSDAANHGPIQLDSDEIDLLNQLVEPFIKDRWKMSQPCTGAGIYRGLMITMLDKDRKLRRIKVEIVDPKIQD